MRDLESRKERNATGEPTKNAPVEAVSPAGRLRATVTADDKMQVRDTTTGKSAVLAEHTATIKALVIRPDGRGLAVGSDE